MNLRTFASTWKHAIARQKVYISYEIHSRLGKFPKLLRFLYRLFRIAQEAPLKANTELVIEGCPRSATTFFYYAFLLAQGRPVDISYHAHLPAPVIEAVQRHIPAVVIVRDPKNAVSSALVREPYTRLRAHLNRYKYFHLALEKYKDDIVIADFENVIASPGQVIGKINEKYGTRFKSIEMDKAVLANINRLLDERHRAIGGNELASYRPNSTKDSAKESIDFCREQNLLDECLEIHRRWKLYVESTGSQ